MSLNKFKLLVLVVLMNYIMNGEKDPLRSQNGQRGVRIDWNKEDLTIHLFKFADIRQF